MIHVLNMTLSCAHLLIVCRDDVSSAKRTRVIDDESDYFATDSNQWLTSKQRDALRSKEAEMHAKRHASRRDRSRQVTLDFAGRRVVEEDSDVATSVTADDDGVLHQPQFNPDDFTVDLVNPNMKLSSPPQVHVVTAPLLMLGIH